MTEQNTARQWIIKVNDSEQFTVDPDSSVEIGRKPIRPLNNDGHRRFEIDDATRSISKRHALFAVSSDGSATLRDLNSTNGSFLVGQDGELARIREDVDFPLSGSPVRLQFGEVPVEFLSVEISRGTTQSAPVSDLFRFASAGAEQHQAGDLSVNDILDVRAGEPTSVFDAHVVAQRAQGKAQTRLQAQSQEQAATAAAETGTDQQDTDRQHEANASQQAHDTNDDADAQGGAAVKNGAVQDGVEAGDEGSRNGTAASGTIAAGAIAAGDRPASRDEAAGELVNGQENREAQLQNQPESQGSQGPQGSQLRSEPSSGTGTTPNADPASRLTLPVVQEPKPEQATPRDLFEDAADTNAETGEHRSAVIRQYGPSQSDHQPNQQQTHPESVPQTDQTATMQPIRSNIVPGGSEQGASYTPVFERGSVFEKVSKGEFNTATPVVEIDGLSSDDAKRTSDFTLQFEMARHSQLLPFLAMNPALYDDLYTWLAAQGNADIDEALAHNEGYADYRKAVGK